MRRTAKKQSRYENGKYQKQESLMKLRAEELRHQRIKLYNILMKKIEPLQTEKKPLIESLDKIQKQINGLIQGYDNAVKEIDIELSQIQRRELHES